MVFIQNILPQPQIKGIIETKNTKLGGKICEAICNFYRQKFNKIPRGVEPRLTKQNPSVKELWINSFWNHTIGKSFLTFSVYILLQVLAYMYALVSYWAIKWSALNNDRNLKKCFVRKFQSNVLNTFCVMPVQKLEFLQHMYGSLTILPLRCFAIFFDKQVWKIF